MSITDIESRSETTYRTIPSVGPSTLVPSISHLNEGELPETAFGQFLIDRGAEISGEPTMDGHWHVVPLMVDGRQVDAQYRALDPQTPDGDFTGELRTADGKVLGLWVGREDGLTLEEQLHARDVSSQELEERELVGRADRDRPVGAPDQPAGQAPAAAGQKTYLAVPFAEKDAAKAAGALWDKKAGAWFVKGSEIPEELFRFMPSDHEVLGSEDPRTAFGKFLRDNGAELQGLPEMDGKWHRIALAGDGKETNASYRGFLDGVPNGQFKNFKGDDVPLQWISKGDALSPEEKQRLVAEAAQNRENRERVRATEQEATAKRAFGIWTNLKSWATPENCPYLARKNVRGYGVKVADDGRMVVPLRDENGRIWSLQFVGDEKIYLKHGRKDGLFHTIDPSKDLENGRDKGDKLTIIIGEGYATGADVHKATNLPTAVAFDGDNLVATAKAVREKFPKANLLIAADDDHHLPNRNPPLPNKGLKCAQRAAEAVGGKVLAPSFTPAEKERGATDWNDLKQIRGEKGLLTALRDSFVQMQREHARSLGKDKGLGRERELSR